VRKIFLVAVSAAAGLLVTSTAVLAHHGQASYEPGKVITLKGTVTEWVWAFPHCYLSIDVKDERGVVTTWVIETQNPVSMSSGGWSRRTFAPGDVVTVTFQPVKSGAPLGLVRSVVLPDGRTLGQGRDAPPRREP
jgi:hypothetical protein